MAENNQPSEDFSTRMNRAKKLRDHVQDEIEEALSFICPGRESDFEQAYLVDEDDSDGFENYSSLPEDLASDFASDLVTYYCPSEARWVDYEISEAELIRLEIDPDEAKEYVEVREDEISEMIQSSNFNDVSTQIMFEANHGTVAMWVEQAHLAQPIHVEPVFPHELMLVPGHRGILDRFLTRQIPAKDLKVTLRHFPEAKLTDPRITQKMTRNDQTVKIAWGFWVSWEDPGNPMWRCEITVDDIAVLRNYELGPLAGACPLLVGRFNPQGRLPWGRGPARKALPDMRVLNRMDEAMLDAQDQALSPSLIYADDGFLNFDEGLMPGRAYPASRGFTREQVYEMNRQIRLEAGQVPFEAREARLRACFYQDGPRQRGDTPPTASQWLDERRRVQQRIGKPSAPLWREFFLPFLQRVEYIGVETGRFGEQVTINEKVISLVPISPLQKAQNQDDILIARSNLELGAGLFAEQLPQVVDPVETMRKIVEASGDRMTTFRDPNEDQNG